MTAHTSPGAGAASAPDPDTADMAGRLRLLVGRLARQLRAHPARDRLTPTQLATLSSVDRHGPLRIGDLAATEGIVAATMTRIVAVLEEQELLERRADPLDGRASQVKLSEQGAAMLARLRSQRTGYFATRLARCTPDERAAIVAVLPLLESLALDERD